MSNPISYNGTLTCVIQVLDLGRSAEWYTRHLGFTKLYQIDDMGWAEFSTPIEGVSVGLSQVEKITGTGNTKLTFGVKNLAETRQQLESDGVKFTGETLTIAGMVKLATFMDPDQNIHMFSESLEKTENAKT